MKFNFLLPKQPAFFDLFAKQGQEIVNIAKLLQTVSQTNPSQQLADFARQAKDIEHRADEVIHNIVKCLNKTFITPFDREDIYNLAGELDDIVDKIENVIHNIEIYNVNPREKFISDFAGIIIKDSACLIELMNLLPQQKYSDQFRDLIVKIHNLEDEGDELFINVLSALFKNGQDAISIIKLKDIVEDLENVLDKFQSASDMIENIVVKTQ